MEEVSGTRIGHGKAPFVLVLLYLVILVWAVLYFAAGHVTDASNEPAIVDAARREHDGAGVGHDRDTSRPSFCRTARGLVMARKARVSKRPRRPRVPLPRQTGGTHEDRSKRIERKAKYRSRWDKDS